MTPDRAKEILHSYALRFGSDTSSHMTPDEEHEVRQGWLKWAESNISFTDFLVKVSRNNRKAMRLL